MSIEVKTDEVSVVQPSNALATPPLLAIHAWRRRRFQIGAAALAVLVIAAFFANNVLARQYSPEGAVRQYLTALQSGDSRSAWPAMQVSGTTNAQVNLTDLAALNAALSKGRPDITNFAVTGTHMIDASTASVSVSYNSAAGTKDATFVVKRSSQNNFAFYPGWQVVVAPVVLQISLPAGSGGVVVDGKSLALGGETTVGVLPVIHQLVFPGSQMVQSQTVTVDAFSSSTLKVAYEPKLTQAGVGKATAAVKAAFATCIQQVSGRPAGCPQSVSINDQGQWRLVGDASQNLAFTIEPGPVIAATGHFQMVFDYSQTGVYGAIHKPAGGGFEAPLNLSSDDIAVTTLKPATGLPGIPRPTAATDQAVEGLVAPAMQACAAVPAGDPGACPQLFAFPDSSGYQWTLVTDPLVDAQVAYDSNTGLFMVRGDFEMKLNYKNRRYSYSTYSTTTTYVAYLFWDGQQLVVITIDGE